MKLLRRCWYDEDDPDHLIYWQIYDHDKLIWESDWIDIRDMSDKEYLSKFVEDIRIQTTQLIPNLSLPFDYYDWKGYYEV